MGSHGGGPRAIQALADALGGKYRNDEDARDEIVPGRRSRGPTP